MFVTCAIPDMTTAWDRLSGSVSLAYQYDALFDACYECEYGIVSLPAYEA